MTTCASILKPVDNVSYKRLVRVGCQGYCPGMWTEWRGHRVEIPAHMGVQGSAEVKADWVGRVLVEQTPACMLERLGNFMEA